MISTNRIIFLGMELNIDPVAFTIMGKEIYWYGIIIALGFCLAIIYGYREASRVGLSPDHIANVVLIGTPAAIIGARLYYVIFNWDQYRGNLGEIIAIWNGGIAIYGALISAVIAGYFYCKHAKIKFLSLADIGVGGFFIGQFIGRWGNFVNGEAYGRETTLPWKMGVTEMGKLIYVHPTFLYESLWNVIGFIVLLFLRKRKSYDGQLFYFYMLWYGMGRIWIEGLRTDSLYWGNFRVSQIVAALCIIAGGYLLAKNKKKKI